MCVWGEGGGEGGAGAEWGGGWREDHIVLDIILDEEHLP